MMITNFKKLCALGLLWAVFSPAQANFILEQNGNSLYIKELSNLDVQLTDAFPDNTPSGVTYISGTRMFHNNLGISESDCNSDESARRIFMSAVNRAMPMDTGYQTPNQSIRSELTFVCKINYRTAYYFRVYGSAIELNRKGGDSCDISLPTEMNVGDLPANGDYHRTVTINGNIKCATDTKLSLEMVMADGSFASIRTINTDIPLASGNTTLSVYPLVNDELGGVYNDLNIKGGVVTPLRIGIKFGLSNWDLKEIKPGTYSFPVVVKVARY